MQQYSQKIVGNIQVSSQGRRYTFILCLIIQRTDEATQNVFGPIASYVIQLILS